MIRQYVALLGAFFIAFIVTPFAARWLKNRGISIHAFRKRDVHQTATPRLGGVILAISFWVAIASVVLLAPGYLRFTNQSILGIDRNLFGVLLGSFIVVIVGAIDDVRGLSAWTKLFWQAVAAAMLPLFGVKVHWLAHPFGGPNIQLSPFADGLLAMVWVILIINVVNFLDGLDGLATGVSGIALFFLSLLAYASFVNQPALALLTLIALGATLGFLPWNWHPARIFLGDAGSYFLGYILGVAAIISGGKLATAGLVLSLPILDALWAIVRRVGTGHSPFQADRYHLHQRLLDAGLSQPAIVIIMMTIAAFFGMIALSSRTTGKVQAFILAVVLMAIILIGISLLERLRDRSAKKE